MPISSRATGKAELVFTGTDYETATGSVNAKLSGAAAAASDLTPVSGDVALTADHGLFQVQRADLQTALTKLNASGQFSVEQPTSNLRVDVASTDASELQRLLISSGVLGAIDDEFHRYNIELGGKRVFKKEAAEALLTDMESALKVIPTKAKFVDDAQRDEVLKIYRDGIATLRQRISE